MDQSKAKTTRETKKETLAGLAEKIKKAKSIAFANYHGLNANHLNQLREKIKQAGGELAVTKNTLLARALESTNYSSSLSLRAEGQLPTTSNQLTGPTATIFAYEDEIAPIKTSAEAFKTQGAGQFKFGFLGNDLLDSLALENLAKIPPRDVLHAKVVGALNSPIFGIVSVLSANIRNFVSVLDQASKKQGQKA